MTTNNFCELTPEIMELSKKCSEAATIDPELYGKYNVKRGLRFMQGGKNEIIYERKLFTFKPDGRTALS